MTKLKVHYNIDPIDSLGANINLIVGERANGKSWQCKHKKGILKYLQPSVNYYDQYFDKGNIIKKAVKEKSEFILMRRWTDDITPMLIEQYFDDVDVFGLTNGEYDSIVIYRKQIFLGNYNDEKRKVEKKVRIGFVVALSSEQRYAGASFLNVTDIIFEEFMARGLYLHNEPAKLMNFYSTVDRKRGTTKLWLVGNSITRVCPYLIDWDLMDIVRNLKQGEIKTTWLPTGEIDDNGIAIEVKIAIEWCKDTGDSSYIIGKHKNMLNKGEWQVDTQPHLQKSYNSYKMLYRIMFVYKTFKFIGEYLMDKETKSTCWFIKEYKGEIKDNILVFSDMIKESKYYQRDIYNPMIKNDKLRHLLGTFRENNIFYASDLIGTDFKQAIDFEIKR